MNKTPPNAAQDERPYHHGDLQRAVVTAALEILAETQSTEFSLRELARRAGVSHNAPYKHFADKRELLGAVSAEGFELLAMRMSEAARGKTSARARLTAMARSHVRHGVQNPALYRLMFGPFLFGANEERPVVELEAAEKIRTLLEDTIIDGALGAPIPRSARNASKIDGAILNYWAQVHGLTLLLVDRLVGPASRADELADRAIQVLIDGLAVTIPGLPRGAWVGPRVTRRSSQA